MEPVITISIADGVTQIEFNHPERGNVFTTEHVVTPGSSLDCASAESAMRHPPAVHCPRSTPIAPFERSPLGEIRPLTTRWSGECHLHLSSSPREPP